MYEDFLRGIYCCKKKRTSSSNLMLTFAVTAAVFIHTGPSKSQENLLHYNNTTEALTGKNDSDEFPLLGGRVTVTRFIALETFHVSFARVSSLARKIYS